jgi:hypothetical protein
MQSYCPFEAYTTTAWCSVASRAKAANAVGFGESRYCLIPLGIFRLNAHSRSIAVWSARPRMLTMSEDFEGLPWLPGPNVPRFRDESEKVVRKAKVPRSTPEHRISSSGQKRRPAALIRLLSVLRLFRQL